MCIRDSSYSYGVNDTLITDYANTFFFYDDAAISEDTLFIAGIVRAQQVATRSILHNNRLRYFNLPLLVGYEKGFRRLKLKALGGLKVSIPLGFNGRVVKVSEDETESIIDNPSLTATNLIQYQIGLGASYKIGNRSNLYFMSTYQQSPTFQLNQINFDYKSLNLQAGIRTILSK